MCDGGRDGTACERVERTEPDERGWTGRTWSSMPRPGRRRERATRRPPAAPPRRAMNTFSAADEEKRRGVRRMKPTATGLLLFVALVYVARQVGARTPARAPGPAMSRRPPRRAWSARWPTGSPSPPSSGTRSACPSRTPRSSPPRRTSWAASLGEFVGENFLSGDVVRQRLRAVGIGSRLGAWLAEPEHADRVTAELADRAARRADRAAGLRRPGRGRRGDHPAGRRPGDRARASARCWRRSSRTAATAGSSTWSCARAHDWLVRARRLGDGRGAGRRARLDARGSSTRRSASGSTRNCCASSPRCATCPAHPARGAARPLPDRLRRRPPVRHGHPRAGGAAQGRGAGPRRGPGPDRLRLDRRTVDDRRRRPRTSAASCGCGCGRRCCRWARGWRPTRRLQAKVDGWVEDAAVYVVTTYRDGDHLADHGHGGGLGRGAHDAEDRGAHRP